MARQSCLAIKAAEHHLGPHVGVYTTKGLLGEACTQEHIFDLLNERKREWMIGVKPGGFNVCAKYKVLMGEAIPKLARGEFFLDQFMKASITRKLRSKYSTNLVPPRNL